LGYELMFVRAMLYVGVRFLHFWGSIAMLMTFL